MKWLRSNLEATLRWPLHAHYKKKNRAYYLSPRVILIFCGPPSKNKPLVTYLVHSIFVCELQNCKHVLSLVSRMTYNTLESKNKIFIHFMHHCELKPKFFVSLTFPSFQLMSLYNHAKVKTLFAIHKWMKIFRHSVSNTYCFLSIILW